ncbi:MAG: hypothetical protein ABEJ26_10855 [Halosimplex sp.]
MDRYEHPAIRVRVAATGAGPVAVRLVETLPAGVDETEVGFHQDERYEHWSVTGDGRLVYEDVLREGETVSTLYGLVGADADLLAECLAAPAVQVARSADIEAVDAGDWVPLGDDGLDVRITGTDALGDDARPTDRQTSPRGGDWADSDTQMDRDSHDSTASAADDSSSTDRSDRSEPQPEEPDETRNRTDRSAQVAGQPGQAAQTDGAGATSEVADPGGDDSGSSADGPPSSPDESDPSGVEPDSAAGESVVEAFAAELRRGDVSEEAVATLRSQLRPERTGSVDAKLDHCMSRIGELDAYVDALEAFLDEEGTAEQVLAEVRDDLRVVEAQLDDLSTRVDSVEAAQSRLDDRFATVSSDLEAVESELERIDDVDDAVDDLDASVEDAVGRVDDLDRTVRETRAELADAVEDVEGEVEALSDDLESVEEWRSSVVDALSATPTEVDADAD